MSQALGHYPLLSRQLLTRAGAQENASVEKNPPNTRNRGRSSTQCSCPGDLTAPVGDNPGVEASAYSTTANVDKNSRKCSVDQNRRLLYFKVPGCHYLRGQRGAYGASRKLRGSKMSYCRDPAKWMEMVCAAAMRARQLSCRPPFPNACAFDVGSRHGVGVQ